MTAPGSAAAGPPDRPPSSWSARPARARPPSAGCSPSGSALTYRDTDADIEQRAGKPIPEIFIDDGEPHFRDLERAAVRAALAGHDGVLSLGGGAVLDDGTRALLAGLPVVFLDVSLHDAVHRVGLDAPRPLLAVNPRQRWRELMDAAPPALHRGRPRGRQHRPTAPPRTWPTPYSTHSN